MLTARVAVLEVAVMTLHAAITGGMPEVTEPAIWPGHAVQPPVLTPAPAADPESHAAIAQAKLAERTAAAASDDQSVHSSSYATS